MMLHTKYEKSRPSSFRQEDFSRFHFINLCKTIDPQGGIVGPRAIFLTNMVFVTCLKLISNVLSAYQRTC